MRLRARLIRALPALLQPHACLLLTGHVDHIAPRLDVLQLECEVCRRRSAGIDTRRGRRGRVLAGDARRFESYARKGISKAAPAQLEPDWFADEHFQGDHARVV